jgi:PIN domain nuclease of toxin-antitoxin system
VIYLDTHVVVWLFSGQTNLLTPAATNAIENEDLLISPMVSLELQYLFEIGKINLQADKIIKELSVAIGLSLCGQPFGKVIAEAKKMKWTRDPFDGIITAQASIRKSRLLTKNTTIAAHYKFAFWN